jgi:MFS family permease
VVNTSPGRLAYVALLSTTTVGTLSSTIMNAPVNTIAADLGATPSQIVFAVSAFTIAMVLFAPLTGWLSERYGATRVLIAFLALMVVAQAGASLTQSLEALVAMRALQGVACSAIPPGVQQALVAFWPGRRSRAMAAWASAVGLGQAIGPPLGGVVADTLGWRAMFVGHAALSALLALVLVRAVPAVGVRRPPMHVPGMALLIGGVGAVISAVTWAGQGGPVAAEVGMVALGIALLGLYGLLSRRSARALVEPWRLGEMRYLRSTAAAGTVMAALGVVLVTVPLYLGREFGLSPGVIGAVTFTLAGSMTLFAPVSSRLADRVTARTVLHAGLVVLTAGLLLLAVVSTAARSHAPTGWLVATLVVTGCAIGAVQSSAAFGVMRSPAAARGSALGIHNMMRFFGLACGYAWVAGTYPVGSLYLVYAGPAVLAAATFLLTFVGSPAPPVDDPVAA